MASPPTPRGLEGRGARATLELTRELGKAPVAVTLESRIGESRFSEEDGEGLPVDENVRQEAPMGVTFAVGQDLNLLSAGDSGPRELAGPRRPGLLIALKPRRGTLWGVDAEEADQAATWVTVGVPVENVENANFLGASPGRATEIPPPGGQEKPGRNHDHERKGTLETRAHPLRERTRSAKPPKSSPPRRRGSVASQDEPITGNICPSDFSDETEPGKNPHHQSPCDISLPLLTFRRSYRPHEAPCGSL